VDEIFSAIKKYKQFTTSIDAYTYNNWCSFGKYDLRVGSESQANVVSSEKDAAAEFLSLPQHYDSFIKLEEHYEDFTFFYRNDNKEVPVRFGYIGPGGSCLLATTESGSDATFLTYSPTFYTSICNITHPAKLDGVESDEQVMYYGFGNYFKVKVDENGQLKTDGNSEDNSSESSKVIVFDGDIYITPHEITTMYKTYNFESVDTLQST